MKVYILSFTDADGGDYGDSSWTHIEGVYSSEERARGAAQTLANAAADERGDAQIVLQWGAHNTARVSPRGGGDYYSVDSYDLDDVNTPTDDVNTPTATEMAILDGLVKNPDALFRRDSRAAGYATISLRRQGVPDEIIYQTLSDIEQGHLARGRKIDA